MMGLIVGDALGGACGIFPAGEEMKKHPVTDTTGAMETYPVPAGSWSDDSSMALASLSALTHGHLRSKNGLWDLFYCGKRTCEKM